MRYYVILLLVLLLIPTVAVRALSTGGNRRLTVVGVLAVPSILLLSFIDQVANPLKLDWLWVAFSVALPLTTVLVVRFCAASKLGPIVQWLCASGAGVAILIAISAVAVRSAPNSP